MKRMKRLSDLQNLRRGEKKNNPLSTVALYELAAGRGVPVYAFDLKNVPSLSIMDEDGGCVVGMAPTLAGQREKLCLAHELGHCITGAFYNRHSSGAVRGKSEYKADKWAFYHLLPPMAVEKAMAAGLTRPHELAEYFDVPEEFLLRALDYYACVRP
ncbi:MAG: ImmA/IrrE family metallo-endopeptidase, partial [Clostridia bacterium]|nr:ImmA/IrrE family metallo-endopeptidase [Clostridia bacterium]